MRLTTSGQAKGFEGSIVGRLTLRDLEPANRPHHIRLFTDIERPVTTNAAQAYQAVLTPSTLPEVTKAPSIERLRHFDHLSEGDIVVIEAISGIVRSLYRPSEKHHSLFVTERCNSNCLMCSQPPKDRDDTTELLDRNLQLIKLIAAPPPYLTITGGEPTLLGKGLFTLLNALKANFPTTEIHMLSNGRTFAWPDFTRLLAGVEHPNFSVGIPLYSDHAGAHDYVVQARGAFDQTITGFHQLARYGIRCEVRVVLHKLTVPRLVKLAEYIYRNLTFVEHIAFMGLENIGYTPRNIEELWIDPHSYQSELKAAVNYLAIRNMRVSIYNHQLCVLLPSLWDYSSKSISDWKNTYRTECHQCGVVERCGGFFKWETTNHRYRIQPIT